MPSRWSSTLLLSCALLACGKKAATPAAGSGSAAAEAPVADAKQAACAAALEHWESIQYKDQTELLDLAIKGDDKAQAARATKIRAALEANRAKLKAIQVARCVTDSWPAELVTCVTTVESKAAGRCERMFTPAQTAAIADAIKAAGIVLDEDADKPAPAADPAEASCDDVVATTRRMLSEGAAPAMKDAFEKMAQLMGQQCAGQAWSVAYRTCARDAKTQDDMTRCGPLLTPEQTKAMEEAIKQLTM